MQYRVHLCPMVSVTQGKIGYVFARDGVDLLKAAELARMGANDGAARPRA